MSVKKTLAPNTSWECSEYGIVLNVSADGMGVIEGTMIVDGQEKTVSVGYRYAGRNAVFDIFEGDWEYAQSIPVEPLLGGVVSVRNGALILKINHDSIGLNESTIVFKRTTVEKSMNTTFNGVYITIDSIDKNENGRCHQAHQ